MKRFFVSKIVPVISMILYIALFVYNVKHYKDFFNVPIYHLLNLAIAVIVAYYFVQKKNDERKLKQIVEDVIDKLQAVITSEDAYTFNKNSDKKKTLQMIRVTNNKINILVQLKNKLDIPEEVDSIQKNFTQYKELVGENLHQIEFLTKNEIELRKLLNLIDNKCDSLRIKLYS